MTLNSYKIIPLTLTGKLSLDTLAGTEWVLTQMKRNEPVQEGAEVTLAFTDDKISGKSACNRYSASAVCSTMLFTPSPKGL